jgi:hypothetical protein
MSQLEQAIELARSGDRAAARELLGQIIKQDPDNEAVWGWLAHCVTTKEEKIYCLKRVVQLNPANIGKAEEDTANAADPTNAAPATNTSGSAPTTAGNRVVRYSSRDSKRTAQVQDDKGTSDVLGVWLRWTYGAGNESYTLVR